MSPTDVTNLPYLISRKTFLVVSGIPPTTFWELVKSGAIRRWVPPRGARKCPKGLYYSADLRRIVGV